MAPFHANGAASTGGLCDPKDRYETPDEVLTGQLVADFGAELSRQDLLVDPCCGTGRLLRRMASYGWAAWGTDLEEDGLDFLEREYAPTLALRMGPWEGNAVGDLRPRAGCVTNPSFSLAFEFVGRALQLFDGPVAMLLPADFLWSQGRRDWFVGEGRPASVQLVPWQIKFFKRDGTRIDGQAYSHQWVVWPSRKLRPARSCVASWLPLGPYLEAKGALALERREARRQARLAPLAEQRGSTPAAPAGQDADETWDFLK